MPNERDTPYSNPFGEEGTDEPGSRPFVTTSLQQAAYLTARGHAIIVRVQTGTHPPRCEFVFARTLVVLADVGRYDAKSHPITDHRIYEKARKQVVGLIAEAKWRDKRHDTL